MLRFALLIAVALAVSSAVAGASSTVTLVKLSTDPYTNASSQHKTEVEPDSFAFGSTVVMAFQVGRFFDGGSSNIGFATSTDNGATWTNGFLPGTTVFATPPGPYGRVSDPSVAYDAKHNAWIIVSLAITSGGSSIGPITSRSTDGGLTWQNPVVVPTAGAGFPDKTWIVCDNTSTSPHYGNCYVTWDDASSGDLVEMNTSTDGGLTWGAKKPTADSAHGLGGQPVVRANGTVVVPYLGSGIRYFTSTNGGSTWGSSQPVATVTDHNVAGSIRTGALPSAEIDKRGRVFVAWQDCRFRSGCTANDIVYAIIRPNGSVTGVKRVPIDGTASGVDHFAPGIGVDVATGGASTHVGLTYYYFPVSNCGSSCQLHIGFVSSTDGGSTWSSPTELAGPMTPTWLANTNQGRMFGDYISTSFVNGKAFPALIVANAPSGGVFDEAAYTTASGLLQLEPGTQSAAGDRPVPNAAADHPPVIAPTAN